MFRTPESELLYNDLRFSLLNYSSLLNNCKFDLCYNLLEDETIQINKEFLQKTDEYYLNDLFVLNMIYKFYKNYTKFWELVYNQNFSKSWIYLQNSNDYLSIIMKYCYSNFDTIFLLFEKQIQDIEKLYPYNVFYSTGLLVDKYICSICGKDIDSFDCPHIQGGLYSGKIATGIADGSVQLDHVAFVDTPKDRRSTVSYNDDSSAFSAIKYVSNQIITKMFFPLSFSRIIFSTKKVKNLNYTKLGRNELCYCGSGKKFKFCCIEKEYLDRTHSEIAVDNSLLNQFKDLNITFTCQIRE